MHTPFDPLNTYFVGEGVVRKLLEQPCVSLPPEERFKGAGVYAIYYAGDFALYRRIAELNRNNQWLQPIYVGKAEPPGKRKGSGIGEATEEYVLWHRLLEHARSIEKVSNLEIKDFGCRYLVVVEVWIPLAERLLIAKFKPVWNTLVDGFGIHDPGSGRGRQKRSDWDMLHPGRPFAEKLPEGNPREIIAKRVESFLNASGI